MLYAVINAQGEPIAQGLTLAEAGHAILAHDGGGYKLRPDPEDGGWVWWGKLPGSPRTAYLAFGSWHHDRDTAEAEILAEVVRAADTARGWPAEAIPQADFDAMQEGGEG